LTFEDDVAAVAKFGVTERQARFLVTVMRHSDSVFDLVSSTAIADALDRGTGRIESQVLPFSYRHLAPLVALHSSPEGVEEGERTPARPQPPSASSLQVAESLTNN
jgi:hypothetical protein